MRAYSLPWLALAALLVGPLVGPPAFAEAPDEPPAAGPDVDRTAARAAFEKGTALFEEDDYVGALREYRRAHVLSPHDQALVPIATCLERLARFREALLEWQQVADSAQVGAPTRQLAAAAVARLKPRLGTLLVEGTPPGAAVFVDDEQRCTLPCRTLVDPREHVVVVRHGKGESRQRVAVARGATVRVAIALAPAGGSPAVGAGASPHGSPGPVPPEAGASGGPGPLTWIGAGVAAVGVAGIIGFGLYTNELHDQYVANPNLDTREDGEQARTLANASIAVAVVGAVAVGIDLLFLAPQDDSASVASRLRWPIRF